MAKSVKGRLSDRMLAVAAMARSCGLFCYDKADKPKIVDIGCDHAFISIFLIQEDIADKVYAVDINDGPLEIAKKNISDYGLGDSITVRKSNGFENIEKGETDMAVIAGMGGYLIIDIIKNAKCLEKGYKLVLSPQSDIYEVRKYLTENGFRIVDEDMMKDAGKYYNIICAEYCGDIQETADELNLLFGEILMKKGNATLKEYLTGRIVSYEKIIDKMNKEAKGTAEDKKLRIEQELENFRFILDKYYQEG